MEQKKKKIEIKDMMLFLLLFVWILIPNLKLIKTTSLMTGIYEYKYMQIVGLIGIYIFVFTILKKIIKNQNRKLLVKELLPVIFLIGYLIWTFFSCIFAENKHNTFYGNEYRQEGFITYLIYAGFFACAFSIESNKLKKYLLNIFIIVAVTNSLLIYIVNNGNNLLEKIIFCKDIERGVFWNQNHYGYYLLLATILSNLFFILENNRISKILYMISYIILLYFLIINNTFGCYLAILITILLFLIYCIYKKKHRFLCLISIIIFTILSICAKYNGNNIVYNNFQTFSKDISCIFDLTRQDIKSETEDDLLKINSEEEKIEETGSGRMRLWKYGIKIFFKNPILGYGADNLQVEYEKYNIDQDRPHNLFIQLATTSGIPGLILYICGVGLIIIRGFRRLESGNEIYLGMLFTIIAYLISAMFGNSMYYTSPYFFILLGMLYKQEFMTFQKNPKKILKNVLTYKNNRGIIKKYQATNEIK